MKDKRKYTLEEQREIIKTLVPCIGNPIDDALRKALKKDLDEMRKQDER